MKINKCCKYLKIIFAAQKEKYILIKRYDSKLIDFNEKNLIE
ncbi:hypothetical protein BHWA1_00026 [Brachyspira hyodysenteriae WA1]|uniref:Uncharacterized protein n=1 Tax=Brachyspira hyodysenteriae (strain ATCC 49526 / WA1) TaxID=565034 RepID=A0A3B6V7S8_BRAHW|nr:hypothetical protein BHWA1_00026 [Brachyspira hyodysenteriae WA1]